MYGEYDRKLMQDMFTLVTGKIPDKRTYDEWCWSDDEKLDKFYSKCYGEVIDDFKKQIETQKEEIKFLRSLLDQTMKGKLGVCVFQDGKYSRPTIYQDGQRIDSANMKDVRIDWDEGHAMRIVPEYRG